MGSRKGRAMNGESSAKWSAMADAASARGVRLCTIIRRKTAVIPSRVSALRPKIRLRVRRCLDGALG